MATRSLWNPTAHGIAVLVPAMVLVGLGLVSIYATETHAQPGLPQHAMKQLAFAAVGLAAMGLTLTVSYQRIGRWAYGMFGVMLVVLALLLVDKVIDLPLINEHKNARRWIDLPWFQIQPSELMKIVFVLSLAKYLQFRKNYRRLRGLLGPFVLTLVPMFLILPEPDLGTVILLLPVLFVMLLAAGARIRHFLMILTLGACAVPVMWLGMTPETARPIVEQIAAELMPGES